MPNFGLYDAYNSPDESIVHPTGYETTFRNPYSPHLSPEKLEEITTELQNLRQENNYLRGYANQVNTRRDIWKQGQSSNRSKSQPSVGHHLTIHNSRGCTADKSVMV